MGLEKLLSQVFCFPEEVITIPPNYGKFHEEMIWTKYWETVMHNYYYAL